MKRIAGVLLAAGTSSRLGRNKLLLESGGEPLVRRAARVALEAGLSPLVVVTGFESEKTRDALRGLPVEFVHNALYAAGMTGSLKTGVRALPQDVDALVMLAADMPRVTAAMITAVMRPQAPLVVSLYGDVIAPPILYARELFAGIEALGDDGKAVITMHRARAAEVAQPAGALHDVDTPEDLLALGELD